MQPRRLTVTARTPTEVPMDFTTHLIATGDTLFIVTPDEPDAAAVLKALDPTDIQQLHDRIATLLIRANAILAEMVANEAAEAAQS